MNSWSRLSRPANYYYCYRAVQRMQLFSLCIFLSLCFSGSLSPAVFFVFLTVSESCVQTFKWNHKRSSTQVWLLTQNSCTFCFSFSVFLFLQIHNWKFPLLSCQFLAPCAPCMLFLSPLRQMELCLQCTRRFGLVLYLNWISALFYFFPLCHRLKIARGTWYLIVYVCECECVFMYAHSRVSQSQYLKRWPIKKKVYESVKHSTILNRNVPPNAALIKETACGSD